MDSKMTTPASENKDRPAPSKNASPKKEGVSPQFIKLLMDELKSLISQQGNASSR
ncbi:MAG: hypothetical protein L0Y56_00295 [Nitrospira sp.]|nr:hypothetical protein [Nitrospira sp.]